VIDLSQDVCFLKEELVLRPLFEDYFDGAYLLNILFFTALEYFSIGAFADALDLLVFIFELARVDHPLERGDN
jgi:hypothetical protein